MAVASKKINITITATDDFSGAFKRLNKEANSTAKRLNSMGKSLTVGLTLPIVAFAVAATKSFMAFDATLTEIRARTGATADEMEAMRTEAIKLGKDTMFSATQAAEAMLELRTSGASTTEMYQQLTPVLNLAAAGMLTLGESADLVTDTLKQFQLDASESTRVVDVLAAGAQNSSATVATLGQGMANVGPIANAMGLSIEETVAALAVLNENGVKAAKAGTSLKSALTNMQRPTDAVAEAWQRLGTSMFDAQGNMRPLDDVIDDIKLGLSSMTQEARSRTILDLAGTFGAVGLNALLASDGIDTMQTAMAGSQSAAQVAAVQMESLQATLTILMGSLQTLMISVIGPFAENFLKPLAVQLTIIANKFTTWSEANQGTVAALSKIIGAIALIGPALIIIAKLITAFKAVKTAIMTIKAAMMALNFATLMNPWGIALIAVGAAIFLLIKNWDKMTAVIKGFFEFMKTGNLTKAFLNGLGIHEDGPVVQALFKFKAIWDRFARGLTKINDFIASIGKAFQWLGRTIVDFAAKVKNGLAGLPGVVTNAVGSFISGISGGGDKANEAGQNLGNQLVAGVETSLQISSPSLVMRNIGQQAGQGFAIGLGQSMAAGTNTVMRQVGQVIKQGAQSLQSLARAAGGVQSRIVSLGGGKRAPTQAGLGASMAVFDPNNNGATKTGAAAAKRNNTLRNDIGTAVRSGDIKKAMSIVKSAPTGLRSSLNSYMLGAIRDIESQTGVPLAQSLGAGNTSRASSSGATSSRPAASSSGLIAPSSRPSGGGVTINIQTLNVRGGEDEEQVQFIMKRIGAEMTKRGGVSGRSLTQ